MTSVRVIKKYPNRRLYDTEESRYITLADVRELVFERTGFIVVDKTSGRDLTRAILLQIIIEQEQHGEPVMSEAFLARVIRSHGRTRPGFAAGDAEHAVRRLAGGLSGNPERAAGDGEPRTAQESCKKAG